MTNINLDELDTEPLFQQATEKQKLFVKAYLTNGKDGTEAAMAAYECSNPNSARSLAFSLLRDSRIIAILNRFGASVVSREQFLAFVWREINRRDQDARYKGQLINLYARMSGFEDGAEPVKAESPANTILETAEEQNELPMASFLSKYEVTNND